MRGTIRKMLFKIILGPLVSLVVFGPASKAAEFNLVPSVTVRQEYNSNIDLDDRKKNEKDDFITKVIPRLRSTYRTERLSLGFTAQAVPTLYWKDEDRSDVDFDGSGNAEYALTPRLSASADARFAVDNQSDRNVATTGQSSGRRYLYGNNIGLSYVLNEITSASLDFGYDRTDYTSREDGEDFQGFNLSAGLSRDLESWLPRTVGQLGAGYGYYDYETSRIQSGFATVGLRHRISEKWEASGTLGARYTHSKFDQVELQFVPPFFLVPVTVEKTNSGWGGVGQFELSYTEAMTRYALSALHDINVAYSDGPTELTSVSFSVNHRIRDEWSAGLSAAWSWNRSDDDEFTAARRDETTYSVSPSLSWTPVRAWTFTAGYGYLWLHDAEDDTNADRHLAFLEATFGRSLFDLLDDVSKGGGFYQPGRLIFPDFSPAAP
jgi:hypothetical protein